MAAAESQIMVPMRREFTSDLAQLAEMRAFVRDACQKAWGLDSSKETISLLELAVAEAITNVILHAYERQGGLPIEIAVEVDDEGATVWIYHSGLNFDPWLVPPPTFDGTQESGFGLYLIQQAVDEVHYFHDETGRCGLRLFKKRERQPVRVV
jgi:anti-sigma regulatory factor (Ser/Thr protein kinase)